MDELVSQMLSQFEAGLQNRALSVMQQIGNEKQIYPVELNKKQVATMLCGSIDSRTFDKRFGRFEDFPKYEVNGKEKFPRDEVLDWYSKNWQRLGA